MPKKLSTTSVHYDDGIVTATLHGLFNEQSAHDYSKKLFGLVRELNGKPFALLADIRHVQGATPDAFDILSEIIGKLPNMGLCAKAYVHEGLVIKGIMFQRIPKLKEMEYLFFTDCDEARDWLSDEFMKKSNS